MILKDEERTKLRQTLGQMKNEIGVLQQALENAPPKMRNIMSYQSEVDGYVLDEYILGFRLGNVSALGAHLHEVFHLTKRVQG